MTRVLVTGCNGQVGVDLVDTLSGETPLGADEAFQPDGRRVGRDEFEVLGLSRHDLDVTDQEAVTRCVQVSRPDVIVNLAAYTAVERAQVEVEQCYAANDVAVGSLSRAAASVGAHLITVSTDYVFDGAKGAAYVEEDATGPLNVYGVAKRAGELRCRGDDTVVRTSWVMGVRGKNVAHVIAERAQSGENVRFVDDQTGTVTVASDLARALVTLVRERPGGTWHVANAGTTTWFEVASFVGRTLGRGAEFVTAISTGDLDPAPLARRPARSDLNCEKWASRGWAGLPEWREGVERLLAGRRAREGSRP